jgi:hypothetical protein
MASIAPSINFFEYNAGSIPCSAQPPTPSATPIHFSVIKYASSPPFATFCGCGITQTPLSRIKLLSLLSNCLIFFNSLSTRDDICLACE